MNTNLTKRNFGKFSRLTAISTFFACLTPISALAAAYGIQYWGGFTVNIYGQAIGIPAGQLAHKITGSGNNISSEWGHISTASSSLCNWRIDHVYFDVNNVERRRITGRVHNRCDTWAYGDTVYPGNVPYGKACAELYRSGAYVTRQCHFITR